jgi:hypothetical protein
MGDSHSIGDKVAATFFVHSHPRPVAASKGQEGMNAASAPSSDKTVELGPVEKARLDDVPAMEPIDFKSRYNIKMDSETGRVFTDIVDPATDSVVGRIPSYFKESSESVAIGETPEITEVTV